MSSARRGQLRRNAGVNLECFESQPSLDRIAQHARPARSPCLASLILPSHEPVSHQEQVAFPQGSERQPQEVVPQSLDASRLVLRPHTPRHQRRSIRPPKRMHRNHIVRSCRCAVRRFHRRHLLNQRLQVERRVLHDACPFVLRQ